MDWDQYDRETRAEFAELLDSGAGERQMQEFLERNPAMVPAAFPEQTGHGAWPFALITQPQLKGFGHRIPDFMWITRNSGAVHPVLIEIEDPGKPWLANKANPQPSHQLSQALNQIRQWREWLEANEDLFFKSFGIPPEWRARRFRPIYVLIYGRKAENEVEIAKLRQYQQETHDLMLFTYDHLAPNQKHHDYLTVRGNGGGAYEAVAMPPTARLYANDPESWQVVSGRRAVIAAQPRITEKRRRFLLDYVKRCDAWAEGYEDTKRELMAQARKERA